MRHFRVSGLSMTPLMLTSALALAPGVAGQQQAGPAGAAVRGLPTFKVDPSWPLEMPNKWILGSVTGVFVDAKHHVWVTHLPETLTEEETLRRAEAADWHLLRRRAAGHRVRRAGQGRAGLGHKDEGRHVGLAAQSARHLRRPQRLRLGRHAHAPPRDEVHARRQARDDDRPVRQERRQQRHDAARRTVGHLGGSCKTNEVYISDGYRNRRVIVFDGATGKYLRHWGAYGEKPDDTEKFDPKTMVSGALPEAVLDAARPHRIEGRQDLRRRPPRQSHSGVRPPGQVPGRENHRAGHAVVGLGVRTVLSPDPQQQWLYSRTAPTTRCGSCGDRISTSSASSGAADGRSGSSCARTA